MIKAILLHLLGAAVLLSLIAALAALLIYLDGPMWANMTALAVAGLLAIAAQFILALFIEERF